MRNATLLAAAFACSTCGRTDLPEAGGWDPPICADCDAAINFDALQEEVDALDTMGLDSTRFLVMPKFLALVLVMPLLVRFVPLMRMLPVPVFDALASFLGLDRGMDEFRGRQRTQI